VLGQQVSVRAATTFAGRLAGAVGVPFDDDDAPEGLARLPIAPLRLVEAGVDSVRGAGLTRARAEALVALARAAAAGELGALSPEDDVASSVAALLELPGIGPWTAQYIAMRALHSADAFPDGDLALRRAMGGITRRELRAASDRWRPFRAYATMHLWTSLA
jgi:3-methyladenine DNA glycosylase/8-oxoguanine DNA glycosylase